MGQMLSISIMKNPNGEWDEAQGDHNLDFIIDGKDFTEIQKVVDVLSSQTKQLEDESFDDYEERLKISYFKAASEKGYEMLGRIWYWYDDAIYLFSDVSQLHEECSRAKDEPRNLDAIIALDKILVACDEALKTKSGIFLGCD